LKMHKNIYKCCESRCFLFSCISQTAVPTKIYCFPWNFHKNIWNAYFLHPRPISHRVGHMNLQQDDVYTSNIIYLILIPLPPFNPLLSTKSEVHPICPPICIHSLYFPSLLHAKVFSS